MRRHQVALSAGAFALASACVSSSGILGAARATAMPDRKSAESPAVSEGDSIIAQAIADREGPRVDIRAEVSQLSSARRLQAAFHVQDDAYVLIGQVDGSGTVRIVFPTDPRDDGFVRGGKSYETPEFFAGFTDEFRFRYTSYYQRFYGLRPDAYDGLMGYVFIVASWRPMHFEKFSTNGAWDSFDLTDEASMRDPKPAIYELASLLSGENREAYTVKFAKYYNTIDYTPYYSNASALGLCSSNGFAGFNNFGFFNPFGIYGLSSRAQFAYGDNFTYRGSRYLYDVAGDCYYQRQPLYYGNPFSIAAVPPSVPTRPRWSVGMINRAPASPGGTQHFQAGRLGPVVAQDANPQTPSVSPTYRQRGLLTDDDGSAMPGRRGPRAAPVDHGMTRPTIQQMVEHRVRDANDNNANSRPTFRGRPGDGTNRGWSSAERTTESYNPPRQRVEASSRYHAGSGGSFGSSGGYTGTRSAPSDIGSRNSGGSSSGSGGSGGSGGSSSAGGSAHSAPSSSASGASSAGASSGSTGRVKQ